MQKLLYILKSSSVAKFFIHIFICNFFAGQCLAMMPSEVLSESASNICAGIRQLFPKTKYLNNYIGIELRQRNDNFKKFDLEITRKSGKTDYESRTLSVDVTSCNSKEFIDFGYGFEFELLNGSFHIPNGLSKYVDYFKTNIDVSISNFYTNQPFTITANTITVQESAISNFSLTLLANTIKNYGIISAPNFNVKVTKNFINFGEIRGNTTSIEGANVINHNGFLNINSLRINADRKFACNNSNIKTKNFTVFTEKFHTLNNSCIKSNNIDVFSAYVYNTESDISASNKTDIFCNIFQNDGNIQAKNIVVDVVKQLINFKAHSDCVAIKKYEYIILNEKFGCIANNGILQADEIYLHAEKHIINQKDIVARLLMNLIADQKFANNSIVQQLEYSTTCVSKINAEDGIINTNGMISAKSELSLTGEFINNTKGILKGRILNIYLAIANDQSFITNKNEELNLQTENNPYSQKFQVYLHTNKSKNSTTSEQDKKDQQNPDPSNADVNDNPEKNIAPNIGHLINIGGTIEATRNIDLRGSGAIYNAEFGKILAKI